MNVYFFQDFLLQNLPVDENEVFHVDLKYATEDDIPIPLAGPFPVDPFLVMSFSKLMKIKKPESWRDLFLKIECVHIVYLLDDLFVKNEEVLPYKQFWLKVYFWNIRQHCFACYVVPLKPISEGHIPASTLKERHDDP